MAVEPTPLSASNPRIADLRRLTGRRRSRVEAGRYVLEGPVPVLELLRAEAEVLEVFVALDAWREADERSPLRAVVREAADSGVPVAGLVGSVLASIADTDAPQGVLAVAPRRVAPIAAIADGDGPVLVLVDVADPGNVGTSLRSAEAAGAAGVVVTGSSTDPFGPKAVRAAAGSVVRLPIAEVDDPLEAIDALRSAGRRTIATVVRGGAAPESMDLGGPVALVLGSEAHGLAADVAAACDERVTIPMSPSVESINVAMAGAVLLFESARQRRDARNGLDR